MSLLWVGKKLLGVFLLLIGIFLVFFFPGIPEHQKGFGTASVKFDVSGIVIGIILLFIGAYLLFY